MAIELKRCPVSCGSQTLTGLKDLFRDPETWRDDKNKGIENIRRLLQSPYKLWGNRPDGDQHIYNGETIIFSDADRNKRGRMLCAIIRKFELGKVTKVSTKNPNTGNDITTYLWVYNGNKIPARY